MTVDAYGNGIEQQEHQPPMVYIQIGSCGDLFVKSVDDYDEVLTPEHFQLISEVLMDDDNDYIALFGVNHAITYDTKVFACEVEDVNYGTLENWYPRLVFKWVTEKYTAEELDAMYAEPEIDYTVIPF